MINKELNYATLIIWNPMKNIDTQTRQKIDVLLNEKMYLKTMFQFRKKQKLYHMHIVYAWVFTGWMIL